MEQTALTTQETQSSLPQRPEKPLSAKILQWFYFIITIVSFLAFIFYLYRTIYPDPYLPKSENPSEENLDRILIALIFLILSIVYIFLYKLITKFTLESVKKALIISLVLLIVPPISSIVLFLLNSNSVSYNQDLGGLAMVASFIFLLFFIIIPASLLQVFNLILLYVNFRYLKKRKSDLSMSKDFTFLPLVLAVVAIGIVAVGAIAYFQFKSKSTPKTQLSEVTQPTSSPLTTQSPIDETADWKTYTSSKAKYSIKYPPFLYAIDGFSGSEASFDVILFTPKKEIGNVLVTPKNVTEFENDRAFNIRISIFQKTTYPDLSINASFKEYIERIVESNFTVEEIKLGELTAVKVTSSNPSMPISIYIPYVNNQYLRVVGAASSRGDVPQKLEGDNLQLFNQMLSTFKFLKDETANLKTLKSFSDSKGNQKHVLLEEKIDPNSFIKGAKIYLSSSKSDITNATKLIDLDYFQGILYLDVSKNNGIKYLMIQIDVPGEGLDKPYIFDETGKEIPVDLTKFGWGTIIPGMAGIISVEWQKTSTIFTIQAVSANGHTYEATFDATTGKQIEETKQID